MKIDCSIEQLYVAVRSVGDVWRDHHADGDGAVGLSVAAGDNQLIVRAASQRSYGQAVVTLSAPAEADLDLLFDASMLMSLLKKLEHAQMHVQERILQLRHDQRSYQLNSLAVDVATRPHDLPVDGSRLLDLDALRQVGDALTLCTSVSDMRTALGGVQLQWQDNRLHLIATDSYRMLHSTLARIDDPEPDEASDVIVPVRAFEWLLKTAKLLHAGAGTITFNDRWLVLRIGASEYATAPQAGRFPHWREIMPLQAQTPTAVVERDDLLAALQRLQPFTGHADHIYASASGANALQLDAKDSVIGQAQEIVGVLEGEIALDDSASYKIGLLINVLGKLQLDQLQLQWPRQASGPLLVSAVDGSLQYLQMPLHTGGDV